MIKPEDFTIMEERTVHDALVNRRSVRDFSSRQVPDDVIRDIVADAQWTPSWANAQPWKVYVASGDLANEIREAYQSGHLRASVDMPAGGTEDWGIEEERNMSLWSQQLRRYLGSDMSSFSKGQSSLFNAPAIAVITIHKDAPIWEVLDAGAFQQSLLLSAYNHGVDSIVAVAFVIHPDYLREKLGIPDNEAIVMGMGLGYRSDAKINGFKSSRDETDNILTIRNK